MSAETADERMDTDITEPDESDESLGSDDSSSDSDEGMDTPAAAQMKPASSNGQDKNMEGGGDIEDDVSSLATSSGTGSEVKEYSIFTPSSKNVASATKVSTASPATPGVRRSHGKPTYVEMAHETIAALKDRTGSSVPAIMKHLLANNEELKKLPDKKFRSSVNNAVKTALKEERFTKVKSSYKINAAWVKKQKAASRAKEAAKKKREQKRKKDVEMARQAKKKAIDVGRLLKKKAEDAIRLAKKEAEDEARLAKKVAEAAEKHIHKQDEERKKMEEKMMKENMSEEEKRKKEEAARKKAEAATRAKVIAERIRRRRFPMEDLQLHRDDKELGVKPPDDVEKRPSLPYTMNCTTPFHLRAEGNGRSSAFVVNASSCGPGTALGREDNRGLVTDALHVYHFFDGDVGFGNKYEDYPVPNFTVKTLLFALDEVQNGNSKAAKALPPLLTHLFLTSLQILTSPDLVRSGFSAIANGEAIVTPHEIRLRKDLGKLSEGLNALSWSKIMFFYMDVMDRFYTTEASVDPNVLPGRKKLDMSYLWSEDGDHTGSNEPVKGEEVKENAEDTRLPEGYYGYIGHPQGALAKGYEKMYKKIDPWNLSAEELMAMLRALTDDILASSPDLTADISNRGAKLHELLKAKKAAESKYRKVKLACEGPKKPSRPKKVQSDEAKKVLNDDAKKAQSDEANKTQSDEAKKIQTDEAKEAQSDETKKVQVDGATKQEPNIDKNSKGEFNGGQEVSGKATEVVEFTPTATKEELLTAEKTLTKSNEAYENGLRKLISRTEPIGFDRHFNSIYFFLHDPEMLHVEVLKPKELPPEYKHLDLTLCPSSSWHAIDTKGLFDQFIASLDVRGIRESEFHDACTGFTIIKRHLHDDNKDKNKKILREQKRDTLERRLECARIACADAGRRSGRLANLAEDEFKKVEEEVKIATQKFDVDEELEQEERLRSVDYSVLTGLETVTDLESKKSRRNKHISLADAPCHKLWIDKEVGGNGALQILIDEIKALEQRCDNLSPWDRDDISRETWLDHCSNSVTAWTSGCVMKIGPSPQSDETSSAAFSPDIKSVAVGTPSTTGTLDDDLEDTPNNSKSKRRKCIHPSNKKSEGFSVPNMISGIKQSLIDLELRIFDISGHKMAVEAADEAGEYAGSPIDDEEADLNKKEVLCWKRKINALNRIATKRASTIRDVLIAAITVARKAHFNQVAADLKAALQLHRPTAANEAKIAAMAVLSKNGGYDGLKDEDDDTVDEQDIMALDKEDLTDSTNDEIASMLCGEAIMMSGSLDGDASADRVDWCDAVKGCKSISKLAALTQCFVTKAKSMLVRVEEERDTLHGLLGIKAGTKKKGNKRGSKGKKHDSGVPVWCNIRLTENFVSGKVQGYPWWPARICEATDPDIASALKDLDNTLISFVGEQSIYMVSEKDARTYSDEDQREDLSKFDKNTIKNFEASTLIVKRICRGRGLPAQSPWRKKSKSHVVEEKKTAH